ncbi:hypothetical protein [Mycobacterium sp.]|uniref:hypothetical protein n=1 Tax=Mycobacterium sp. TaxID=1785 RepID=UPI003BAA03F0
MPQAWHVCLSASTVDSGAGGVDGAAVTVTICGAADAATVTAGSGVTANVTAVVMMPATAALAPSDAVIAGQRRWFCRGSGRGYDGHVGAAGGGGTIDIVKLLIRCGTRRC